MFFYLLTVPLSVIFFFRWRYKSFYKAASVFKHDMLSLPFLGLSYLFLGSKENHMKGIQRIGRESIKQGGIVAGWFGPRLYVSIADPAIAEVVLKNFLEKDDLTRFVRSSLGNGTIFAPVPIWYQRRKIAIRNFTTANLKRFMQKFREKSDIVLDLLSNRVGKGPFASWDYFLCYSMDTLCETTLGVKADIVQNPKHPFLTSIQNACHLLTDRTCKPWLHPDCIFNRLARAERLKKSVECVHDFIGEVIESTKKKAVVEGLNKPDDSKVNESPGTLKSFLDSLLATGVEQGYTNVEMKEETLALMAAGSDTTAASAAFAISMLAKHPDVQDKVYEELKEVFEDSERQVEIDDITRLRYLDVVIKETLRLFPAGPVLLRKVDRDINLGSGAVIPKGCGALINVWAIHRNPKYWGEDAELFRPERFLDTAFEHPAQFIPFSYGPRSCVGSKYATLSIKTLLATLLRQYRVLPGDESDTSKDLSSGLLFNIIIKDVNRFPIRLEKR